MATMLAIGLVAAGCGEDDGGQQPPELILERSGEPEPPGDAPPPTFPNTATANTVRVAGRNAMEDAAGVASAVFPATDGSTRPEAVTLVDADDWRGGVAAAVLAGGVVGAPILLTDGDSIPAVTEGTLERLDPGGADLVDDAQVIAIGADVPRPDERRTEVVEGADPFELAAEIDRLSAAAEGEPSGNVIVASADDPAFAMPAAAWAARSQDPVLFTAPDSLPEATREAIEEHDRPSIFVLGPESVVSQQVEDELDELGRVRRIEGETPVENAIEFARYQTGDFGWGLVTPGHNFTLASTRRELDAAAAAPLATNGTFAPLLVTDTGGELPDALRGYFLDIQPGFEENPNRGVFNRVWILGDQDAISLAFQARLDELLELIPVDVEPAPDAPPPDGRDEREPEEAEDDGGRGDVADSGDLPPGPGGIPAPQGPGLPLQ